MSLVRQGVGGAGRPIHTRKGGEVADARREVNRETAVIGSRGNGRDAGGRHRLATARALGLRMRRLTGRDSVTRPAARLHAGGFFTTTGASRTVRATAAGQTGQDAQAERLGVSVGADAGPLRGAGEQRQERRQPNLCDQKNATHGEHNSMSSLSAVLGQARFQWSAALRRRPATVHASRAGRPSTMSGLKVYRTQRFLTGPKRERGEASPGAESPRPRRGLPSSSLLANFLRHATESLECGRVRAIGSGRRKGLGETTAGVHDDSGCRQNWSLPPSNAPLK